MRIVALALDTYGDHVLRQPLLAGLLDAGHAVTLVMRRQYADIVPYLDQRLSVIECEIDIGRPLTGDRADWPPLQQAVGRIRKAAPDIVISLPYNRSAADEWLLRSCDFCERMAFFPANRPDSLIDSLPLPDEFKPPLDFLATVTRAIDAPEFSPEVTKNEILLRCVAPSQRPAQRPRLSPRPADQSAASAWLQTSGIAGRRYAILAPAGTVNNPLKRMPVSLAVASIERLWCKYGIATVLAGIESERPHLEDIRAGIGTNDEHVTLWIGEPGTLSTLLGLLKGADAYVGADLGTMHFAAAVGIPLVALFGGGHFPRFEPAAERWAAVTKRLACFGCEWKCLFSSARCIEEVSVDTWLGALDAIMEGQSPGWSFDPAGLDEKAARVTQPAFARMRQELRVVERDRAERLALIETQDLQIRRVQSRLVEVESDRAERLDKLLNADRELVQRQQAIDALASRVSSADLQLGSLIEERDELKRRLSELPAIERDRAERLVLIQRQDAELRILRDRIDEIDRDRAARLALVERQHAELEDMRRQLQEIEGKLKIVEAGLAAQSTSARSLATALDDANSELAVSRNEAGDLKREGDVIRARLERASLRLADLQTTRGALRVIRSALLRRPKHDEGLDGS